MEPPSLKLVILQGPRKGETLEFRPGSTIRIGRIVRGNNLSIKDAAISSNHLLIASESGKWAIQDLDSSNGTSLNSTKLPPFKPFHLSHSDTVKLGEATSILVELNEQDQPPRRITRRGGRGAVKKETAAENPGQKACGTEVNKEDCQVEEKAVPIMESRRRGRPRKNKETDSVGPVKAEPRELRSTRGRKNEHCVGVESLEQGCRMTRGDRRKRQNLQELPLEEDVKEVCVRGDDKENRGGTHFEELESKKTRRGRSRRQDLRELLSEDMKAVCVGEDDKNREETHMEELESKKPCRVVSRRRQDLRELPQEDVKDVCVGIDEKVKKEGGLDKFETEMAHEGARKNENRPEVRLREVDVGEDVENNNKGLVVEKESEEVVAKMTREKEVEENVKLRDLEKECGETASKNEDGMKPGDKLGKGEGKFDLEKMTLGEWFDYMEEHLPRQIIEATEEMIDGMRRKAERVREYMMEQKRRDFEG